MFRIANQRYRLLEACQNKQKDAYQGTSPRTIRDWRASFRDAEVRYGCGYVGLLPKTTARGNRNPKAPEAPRRLLEEAIEQLYARPKQQKVREVFLAYQRTCLEQEIQPLSERSFYRYVKKRSGPALTEQRKGARAAYQESPWLYELERTTPQHGDRPWEIVHLDHTQLDIELIPICVLTDNIVPGSHASLAIQICPLERKLVLDEAQHLLKLSSGVKLIDQLDWLKSMTNTTGVLHILTGTYELLPLRNLNGQAARRGLEIHFPRYQFQHEPDQLAFQRVLLTLLQQIPLEVEIKPFVDQWPYFYERCIGCIGVLKDWLVRALAATIGASQTKLLFERIAECALPIAQCESMALEAAAGEQELHYTASRRQHLWALLGMNMGGEVGHLPMKPAQEVLETNQGSRVGEQQPVRLEVGEPKSKGRTENCSFSGAAVALQPAQLTAAGIEKLQCPECGAARKATVRGETITFPSHTPLRIPRAQKGSLWIRQGTTWTIR